MPDDRASAERRVHQIRAFRAELAALAREGVTPFGDEDRRALDAHHDRVLDQLARTYDIDRSETAAHLSRGMQLTSLFAAVALTAAVYSLVSRFWGRLDLAMQATLLCAFPLVSLVCVEWSAHRDRTLYIASLFALVAYGTFWLAVVVLSAALNLPVTPLALWAGVVFGLALALPYGFRVILGAALAVLPVALAGSIFQSAGIAWTETASRPEVPALAALGTTALAPRLMLVHQNFGGVTRLVGLGLGLSGLLVLTVLGGASLLPLSNAAVEVVYQAAMLVLCVAILVVSVRRHWSETVALTAVMLTVFLLTRFVDWFWDALPRYVFFLVLAAIAFGWLLALRRLRTRLAAS